MIGYPQNLVSFNLSDLAKTDHRRISLISYHFQSNQKGLRSSSQIMSQQVMKYLFGKHSVKHCEYKE